MQIAIEQFQSTLPQGERQETFGRECKYCDISIHAPARGATLVNDLAGVCGLFQSTLPQGERHLSFLLFPVSGIFQSTLPQGERLVPKRVVELLPGFQSTLPQGERPGS